MSSLQDLQTFIVLDRGRTVGKSWRVRRADGMPRVHDRNFSSNQRLAILWGRHPCSM
jgi:hypothetical protein